MIGLLLPLSRHTLSRSTGVSPVRTFTGETPVLRAGHTFESFHRRPVPPSRLPVPPAPPGLRRAVLAAPSPPAARGRHGGRGGEDGQRSLERMARAACTAGASPWASACAGRPAVPASFEECLHQPDHRLPVQAHRPHAPRQPHVRGPPAPRRVGRRHVAKPTSAPFTGGRSIAAQIGAADWLGQVIVHPRTPADRSRSPWPALAVTATTGTRPPTAFSRARISRVARSPSISASARPSARGRISLAPAPRSASRPLSAGWTRWPACRSSRSSTCWLTALSSTSKTASDFRTTAAAASSESAGRGASEVDSESSSSTATNLLAEALRVCRVIALLLVQRGLPQQLDQADDLRNRRAQLVAHAPEKVACIHVGILGLPPANECSPVPARFPVCRRPAVTVHNPCRGRCSAP